MLVAITGSQPPYLYDLPQVLALPMDFEARFRYKRQWIATDVLSRLSGLAGQNLVLVFHSQARKVLLPIRMATIVSAEQFGAIVFLRFRVGEFIDPVQTLKASAKQMQTANAGGEADNLVTIDGYLGECSALGSVNDLCQRLTHVMKPALEITTDLQKPLPKNSYLVECGGLAALREAKKGTAEESALGWTRIAALLHAEPDLAGIPMFHILGFEQVERIVWPPHLPFQARWLKSQSLPRFRIWEARDHGYCVREGSRIKLRVLLWREKMIEGLELPAYRAQPVWNTELLRLEGSTELVVGKYDVLEYSFEARRPGYGEVGLTVNRVASGSAREVKAGTSTGDSHDWPQVLAARVPVQVRHNVVRLCGVVAFAVVGVLLLGVTDHANVLGTGVSLSPELSKAAGIILLTLAVGELVNRFGKVAESVQKLTHSDATSGGSGASGS